MVKLKRFYHGHIRNYCWSVVYVFCHNIIFDLCISLAHKSEEVAQYHASSTSSEAIIVLFPKLLQSTCTYLLKWEWLYGEPDVILRCLSEAIKGDNNCKGPHRILSAYCILQDLFLFCSYKICLLSLMKHHGQGQPTNTERRYGENAQLQYFVTLKLN